MTFTPEPSRFEDIVVCSLKIKVGSGDEHEVPAGNIKRFRVMLREYGFDADFDFWHVGRVEGTEDKIFPDFKKDDPIEVTFTMKAEFSQADKPPVIQCTGLVTTRSVVERSFEDVDKAPVFHRRYMMHVVDRAEKLWSEAQALESGEPKKAEAKVRTLLRKFGDTKAGARARARYPEWAADEDKKREAK